MSDLEEWNKAQAEEKKKNEEFFIGTLKENMKYGVIEGKWKIKRQPSYPPEDIPATDIPDSFLNPTVQEVARSSVNAPNYKKPCLIYYEPKSIRLEYTNSRNKPVALEFQLENFYMSGNLIKEGMNALHTDKENNQFRLLLWPSDEVWHRGVTKPFKVESVNFSINPPTPRDLACYWEK